MSSYKERFVGTSIGLFIAIFVVYGFFALMETKLNPFDWIFPSRLLAGGWWVWIIYNYFERMSKKFE